MFSILIGNTRWFSLAWWSPSGSLSYVGNVFHSWWTPHEPRMNECMQRCQILARFWVHQLLGASWYLYPEGQSQQSKLWSGFEYHHHLLGGGIQRGDWNSSANPQTSNGTSLSLSLSLSQPSKADFFLKDFLCSQAKDRKKIQLLKLFAYVESLVESLILWWELNYISSTSILYYMNGYRIN